VTIETRLHTGDWWGNGEPIHITAVRGVPDIPLGQIKNVTFLDITCKSENGILLYGSSESHLNDIRFENIRFEFTDSKLNDVAGGNIDLRGAYGDRQLFAADISAFYAQYVDKLSLNDVTIQWGAVSKYYFQYGIHISQFNDVRLNNVKAVSSPANPDLPAVMLENGSGLRTNLDAKMVGKKNVQK